MATMRSLPHTVLVSELRNMLSPAAGLLAQGVRRREVYASNKLWAVPMIIERTDLVGFMPRWFRSEIARNFDVVAHELPIELPNQSCAMIWLVRSGRDPGHTWLRESLAAAFLARLQSAAE